MLTSIWKKVPAKLFEVLANDRCELNVTGEVRKVVIVGALFRCTQCTRIKPASEFGMRKAGTTVRTQPQCKACRNTAKRSAGVRARAA